jgi:hypothetical protein
MEKFIQQNQGIVVFLMAQAIILGSFLLRLFVRVSKLEDDMKSSKEDFAILEKKMDTAVGRVENMIERFHKIDTETEVIKVKMLQISDIANDIKTSLKVGR